MPGCITSFHLAPQPDSVLDLGGFRFSGAHERSLKEGADFLSLGLGDLISLIFSTEIRATAQSYVLIPLQQPGLCPRCIPTPAEA
jgi:hypothetical protein